MSIRLHDSATRQVREFSPRVPGQVGIYLCGATVQGAPHIGHLRSAIAFDVLVRWLRRSGYQVTLVRNVTDIDDKILTKSAEAGAPWWAWANRFEREFNHAYEALGVLPPTYEPRATGHIPEMIELIARLIERGHAYSTAAGNVYFDVSSWPNYGELTHQSVDQLTSAEDEASDKGDPHDFALWKAAKDTDPEGASWATPWGRGRPGWHLECSTMSRKYLGEGFDIHGGGIDLRFPHHENETAQSKAAGWPFANLWMHNAWVTVGGEKMSKSLGNSLTVDALLERTSAAVLRYALAAVHYRSTLEFSDVTVAESQAAWERIVSFVERSAEVGGAAEADQVAQAEVPREFADALNDDLNVSAGLAVIHDQLRAANTALAAGDKDEVAHAHVRIRAMLAVLGLDPLAEPWAGEHHSGSAQAKALASLVEKLLQERASARGAKDFARADALRDQLTEAGIAVEDGADGARWSVRGEN